MNKEFKDYCALLTDEIKACYESTVTMQEAEKLAARFLVAQLTVAEHLYTIDLDSRMRKSGLKAVKAAIYMSEATKSDKKPSDTFLQNMVDLSELVQPEQKAFDEAEAERDALQNYLNIFKEAHVFFRQVSKGSFNG